ncbi:MAG TPA: hypothetical protein P5181_01450 [Dermatophilaceae bacterium]|nr:hypothetical protein [Dermatophilaceae bacterium]
MAVDRCRPGRRRGGGGGRARGPARARPAARHLRVVDVGAWLSREVGHSFVQAGTSFTRTLPLLVGVVTFFFFTGELWQTVGELDPASFALLFACFIGLSAAFLSSRTRLDLDALARFPDPASLTTALAHTPYAAAAPPVPTPAQCPLSTGQRATLRLVATMSRLVIAGLVGVSVFVFYLVLAMILLDPPTLAAWTGAEPQTIIEVATGARRHTLAWEQVKVATFLALFSGFYYAVASATDAALRETVRDTAEEAVREACAARLAVLSETRR